MENPTGYSFRGTNQSGQYMFGVLFVSPLLSLEYPHVYFCAKRANKQFTYKLYKQHLKLEWQMGEHILNWNWKNKIFKKKLLYKNNLLIAEPN